MTVQSVSLNCLGLQCPAPILAISKIAKTTPRPATLEVRADDGDFAVDVRAWCRSTGAVLESLQEVDGTFVARIALEDAPRPAPTQQTPPAVEAVAAPLGVAPPVRPLPSQPTQSSPRRPDPTPEQPGGRIDLDCRGLMCPAPILHLTQAAKDTRGRPTLIVARADDGDFPADVDAWCRSTGALLVAMEEVNGTFVATVGVHGAGRAEPRDAPRDAPEPRQDRGERPRASQNHKEIDLRGRAAELGLLELGQQVFAHEVVHFVADHGPIERQLKAWATVVGATVTLERDGALVRGRVQLDSEHHQVPATTTTSAGMFGAPSASHAADAGPAVPRRNKATLLVLRNDFESLMAAMMVANASAAQGMEVDVYFAFWGVNVLRSRKPKPVPAALQKAAPPLRRMMKWMMPAGPEAQPMSKMNFGGIGLGMMKVFMRQQNIQGLTALMREAGNQGVNFIVCTMSMGIMGVEKHDLMDLPTLKFGGVTAFSGAARESAVSLVF